MRICKEIKCLYRADTDQNSGNKFSALGRAGWGRRRIAQSWIQANERGKAVDVDETYWSVSWSNRNYDLIDLIDLITIITTHHSEKLKKS